MERDSEMMKNCDDLLDRVPVVEVRKCLDVDGSRTCGQMVPG